MRWAQDGRLHIGRGSKLPNPLGDAESAHDIDTLVSDEPIRPSPTGRGWKGLGMLKETFKEYASRASTVCQIVTFGDRPGHLMM
jgi:hypothetical protein